MGSIDECWKLEAQVEFFTRRGQPDDPEDVYAFAEMLSEKLLRSLRLSWHWKTQRGEQIPVTKLEDSHLANCIRFVERQPQTRKRVVWSRVLRYEQEQRKQKVAQ